MEFKQITGQADKQRSPCIVVPVFEAKKLSISAEKLDSRCAGYISKLLKQGDFSGSAGETLMLHQVPKALCQRILLVGCGKINAVNEAVFRKAVSASIKVLQLSGATEALSYLTELDVGDRDYYWKVRQITELAESAIYKFDQTKSKKTKPRKPLKQLTMFATGRKELNRAVEAINQGSAIAAGMSLARDLGNLPGNICTPSYLASQARSLKKQHKALKVNVLEEKDMKRLGMGSLLSVSRGSRQPAKLIVMHYKNAPGKPHVLVGKGVTFDSGGISIKPGAAMDEMKFDMCGAASVFGTMKAVLKMKLPINMVGIVAASENLPDGDASKPGDIVTSMSGQTIEVLNTDAEGRLVLCDALTYSEKFKPESVIDIATLTGACVIALGKHASGLLGNNANVKEDILAAGNYAFDRAWEMPMWDEYQEQINSNFADMANIGGREGGTITAACFLSRFTKNLNWAHLDIAGTAWLSGAAKGATGRPVPLLTQYMIDRAQ